MMMMMVSAIILYTPTTGSIYIFHLVTLINHLAYLYRTMGGPSNREHRKENSAEISFYNLFFFFFKRHLYSVLIDASINFPSTNIFLFIYFPIE